MGFEMGQIFIYAAAIISIGSATQYSFRLIKKIRIRRYKNSLRKKQGGETP